MASTTIKLSKKTKRELDRFREQPRETYEQVVRKLVQIADTARDEPSLSKEAVDAIDEARARIKSGTYVSEEEARKRLGM